MENCIMSSIPKIPSPQSPSKLKPIAITNYPAYSEDFVHEWAYDNIKQSIDPKQYDNIRTSFTSHYLVTLLDFLHRHLDKSKTSLAVNFIDKKKNSSLLITASKKKKKVTLGLSTSPLSWLSDFLSCRSQVVRYRGAVSTTQPLTCGVPR